MRTPSRTPAARWAVLAGVAAIGCAPAHPGTYAPIGAPADRFAEAAVNGELANEAFVRSQRLIEDWLQHADPRTGLLPRNLTNSRDYWNAWDSAADLYPFLVLGSAFTDRALYEGRMREILLTETALTSRLGRLPDTYSFTGQAFRDSVLDVERVALADDRAVAIR